MRTCFQLEELLVIVLSLIKHLKCHQLQSGLCCHCELMYIEQSIGPKTEIKTIVSS